MSWTAWQTKWRASYLMGGVPYGPFYIDGTGYVRYLWYTGSRNTPTISHKSSIGYSLKINGSVVCKPNYIFYNGYAGYSSGTGYNIWYDYNFGWVLSRNALGSPLYEAWYYRDPTNTSLGGYYYGPGFYTLNSSSGKGIALGLGQTVTAYGRGYYRGDVYGCTSSNTYTISTTWEYWQTSADTTFYGKYLPKGTASGNRYFGSPQWKNGTIFYCRKPSPVSTKYSYGSITWNNDAAKYVLGVYGSPAGWHESDSAPVPGSSWTFRFAKSEGSEAEGENLTLSWDNWVLGPYTKTINVMRASSKWTSL